MSETKPSTTPDIFNINETRVTLTYSGLGIPPITFFLRPFLHKEEQLLRQAHFALADDSRKKEQHAYNVELLARLSTRAPEGLSGFTKEDYAGGFAANLRAVLAGPSPMKEKLAEDALTRYYQVTQPAEFFRGV